MKTKLIYFLLLVGIISCNKFDGPYIETIDNYVAMVYGSGQKGEAGDYLKDSVGVMIIRNTSNYNLEGYTAHFRVVSGGGQVDDEIIPLTGGVAKTKWKTGTNSNKQTLEVEIFDKNDMLVFTPKIEAIALRHQVWDTISTFPDIYISDVLSDTILNKTTMIASSGIYYLKDSIFNWNQDYQQYISGPFSMFIDNSGTYYVSNWYGSIYKSINGGNSWNLCSQPIPGHQYYYFMTVAPDGYIWASAFGYKHSLRCSRDGGNTWSADTLGLDENEVIGNIYRLSNGTIFFHSASMYNLYKSEDDGKTWQKMNHPQFSLSLFVTENDEIIIINQQNGISFHKSTDMGQTYRKTYSVWPQFVTTAMNHIIVKKDNFYYILIPGYGIVRTVNFEDFEQVYHNEKIVYLFRTHDGSLIAKGLDNANVYCYRD